MLVPVHGKVNVHQVFIWYYVLSLCFQDGYTQRVDINLCNVDGNFWVKTNQEQMHEYEQRSISTDDS